MALTYFATDGNYGDARDLWVVETDEFTADDYEDIDRAPDYLRVAKALTIVADNAYSGLCGPVLPVDIMEVAQAKETLNAVMEYVTANGFPGWGEELGDILNIFERFVPAQ